MQHVDKLADNLVSKIETQQKEIEHLRSENEKLKNLANTTLRDVQGYLDELEQIKKSLCQ
jgi:uncharacterized protein YoxC